MTPYTFRLLQAIAQSQQPEQHVGDWRKVDSWFDGSLAGGSDDHDAVDRMAADLARDPGPALLRRVLGVAGGALRIVCGVSSLAVAGLFGAVALITGLAAIFWLWVFTKVTDVR